MNDRLHHTKGHDPHRTGRQFDNWDELTPSERIRRANWLCQHGRSPVGLLRLSDDTLSTAGLFVLDWGAPVLTEGATGHQSKPDHAP